MTLTRSAPASSYRINRERGADPSSTRGLLWQALSTRRADLVLASTLYSTHQLGEALVPVIVGGAIGQAVDHGTWSSMVLWLVLLGADFVLLSLSYRFGARASMRAKQHVSQTVRMWLADRILDPAGGNRHDPGDLVSRASSDADRVGAFAGFVASAIAAVVVLAFSTALLLRLSVSLAATVILGTSAAVVIQNRVSTIVHQRSGVEQMRHSRANTLATDVVRGLRILKGIGAQHRGADAYRIASQDACRASLHAASAQATMSAVGAAISGVYLTAVVAAGSWLALTGQIGLGELVAALGLAQFVVGPMQSLSGVVAAYARALASAGRIRQIVSEDPAVVEKSGRVQSRSCVTGDIEVRGVPLARNRLHVTIEASLMTGIVCGVSSDAAAVAALLAREHDPEEGAITVGGTDISTLPLDVLRQAIVVSHHDSVLFPGTIADNLSALTADDGSVAAAAEAAFADQVMAVAPSGGQTMVGDRGESLSGGQRQRIALGRALAGRSPVLVLHDPTTAVDALTEDRIAARVRRHREGRTTIVITTSPAWLSRCDRVIFVRDHSVLDGTHAQLSASEPSYRAAVSR